MPPPLKSDIIVSHKFRFQSASSLTNQSVSTADLTAICGGLAATTTSWYPWAKSFRIKWVEMWSSSSSGNPTGGGVGGVQTVQLKWTDGQSNFGPAMEISDSTTSGLSAHIKTRPPPRSLCAFWQGDYSGATPQQLFSITCDEATIIDIQLEFVLLDDPTVNGRAYTTVSPFLFQVGLAYYRYLVSTSLPVIGLNPFP